ncbi:GTP-binding protein TypA [Candidatus Gottesmanbacteria bacterium RIFCSPHIGHO2_02_FULL_40_13]|uniref:GTP-binding protein TypA n=1 Tax=Candidatus Gottesmanbacteria bacterium RIFCSPHIGHO2_02_FULL_40_13 TaxID=1798384 RepID=A0A1F6A7Z8_9BACT|nr:MAG: GTP-binding protein TypA [Candidatus Gottesmanbacteria bacterium RIFCSPHIGHO2_02_FULL_40_13]
MNIRNIAIIAHVDHGKTTLVDAMLKQTHTFRDNQAEMSQTTILDSGDLEREKGITILAKNTAVVYKDTKINIIDTPGHADFSGEVERIINMVDGALLIIDAAEGPLAQTRFVLETALEHNLKIIVVINKIDRKDQRAEEVLQETENLILYLAKKDSHLDYTMLYAVGREGKAWKTMPPDIHDKADISPIFETILSVIPAPISDSDLPFKMQVSTLDFDDYKGTYAIGKLSQGSVKPKQKVNLYMENNLLGSFQINQVFTSQGLERLEVAESTAGDIIAVTGIPDIAIGQTITDPSISGGFPDIHLSEPTLKITISPNTSPLAGREGKFTSARQLEQRLAREMKTNIGLRIRQSPSGGYEVSGRGELHLAILLETLRREGFEMQIGKPKIIFHVENNETLEPFEEVSIDIDKKYIGIVVEEIGRRKAEIIDVKTNTQDITRYLFTLSSRNLMGLRSLLISKTGGKGLFSSRFIGYRKMEEQVERYRNGVLIALESGKSTSYALETAQQRGTVFIGPGEAVYEGMIIGLNSRREDMEMNIIRFKKLTNMHTENSDVAITLDTPLRLSLEQCLDFLEDDEMLEITPLNLRLRKAHLNKILRKRAEKRKNGSINDTPRGKLGGI